MIVPEDAFTQKTDDLDEKLAGFYMMLIETALKQKRATPVAKRDASEAIYFDALEAGDDDQEFNLLLDAIKTDPCNAAVLLRLKEFFPLTLEEDILATRAVVAIAEKRLGKKTFKQCAGQFWGFIETRPYMRARCELARLLEEAGMDDEAMAELEAMITLNTNDNQGFRYLLLPRYMSRSNLDKADWLFSLYPEEDKWCLTFAWCRVLERLMREDDSGAKKSLAVAREQNGFAEAYILGHRRPPKTLPDRYASGSREEAECFAKEIQNAWSAHPDAIRWLKAQPKTL